MKKIIVILFTIFTTVVLGFINIQNVSYDKIVFEGFGNCVDMSTSQKVNEVIEEENVEELKLIIVGKTDFKFDIGIKENLTDAEAEKIQEMRRNAGASYYKEFNQKLFESLPEYNYKNVYISKYFPQVVLDVESSSVMSRNSTLLYELSKNELIETVFVQNNQEVVNSLNYAFGYLGVYDEVNTGTLTGNGVKVGMVEGGILDEDNVNFSDITVEARDAWYFIETVSDHTTTMASCIGGREGVARRASIYSVQGAGNPSSELDWLIDKGVNVINCSYGYSTANGEYSSHSASYDYVVWTYGISVIAASGNENSGETDYYIFNPGLAYNAITVGGAYTATLPWNGTCYEEVTNVDKPTLIAPAYQIHTTNANPSGSGTSYSTALTTGCAALLMEYCPDLKVYPAKLTALLSACAYPTAGYFDLVSGLDDEVGCGLVDFEESKDSINNCIVGASSATDQADDYIIEQDVYFEKDNLLQIAVAWNGKSGDSVSSWQLNNYVLCLFRPAGAQIVAKYSLYNNVLFITYETQYTGNYKIMLIQEGDLVYTDTTPIFIYYSVRPLE